MRQTGLRAVFAAETGQASHSNRVQQVFAHRLQMASDETFAADEIIWVTRSQMPCFLREAFVRSYLERDLPQLGIRIPSNTLRRFWLMLAHHHGQLWNASTIAASLGITAPSVRHYLDILESTFMVRVLQPYSANLGKRLIKSPKIYLRDSGVLHTLLNLPDHHTLMGHPVLGASWEGWVIEQIMHLAPKGSRPCFFRTASGNEIDLLLELSGGNLRAIEIKHSATPRLGRGFAEALDALKLEHGFVVAPVNEPYPLSPRATVLPLTHIRQIWGG